MFLSAEHFHDKAAALAFIDARTSIEWSGLPALWRAEPDWSPERQDNQARHVQVLRLPHHARAPNRRHQSGPGRVHSILSDARACL